MTAMRKAVSKQVVAMSCNGKSRDIKWKRRWSTFALSIKKLFVWIASWWIIINWDVSENPPQTHCEKNQTQKWVHICFHLQMFHCVVTINLVRLVRVIIDFVTQVVQTLQFFILAYIALIIVNCVSKITTNFTLNLHLIKATEKMAHFFLLITEQIKIPQTCRYRNVYCYFKIFELQCDVIFSNSRRQNAGQRRRDVFFFQRWTYTSSRKTQSYTINPTKFHPTLILKERPNRHKLCPNMLRSCQEFHNLVKY